MYSRYLKLNLPNKQSAFLWGARKTGKSTFLRTLYPDSVVIDLLDAQLEMRYTKAPWEFRQDILSLEKNELDHPIIIDEVQRVPSIMSEIHWLIENTRSYFILCGSSARKMRRAGVHLLGGRAIRYNFYPLVYQEMKQDFDIIKIFNHGLLPSHYLSEEPKNLLDSYIYDYLTSEIKAEGLVRNLATFNRFLDSVAFSHGEMLNYTNIARDVGVSTHIIKEYYRVLEDTLIGNFVYPYSKKSSRRLISASAKFYFFDVGIANRLLQRTFETPQGIEAGKALEHYIFLELLAYTKLNHLDQQISYWRTNTGIEVDFVAHLKRGDPIPIEVKISKNIHKTELKGLKIFMQEYNVKTAYMVCMSPSKQKILIDEGEIIIFPLQEFLDSLWNGKIIK